jgi:DNA polymerase I-like protein with 3'-5' exonuclease and polymerase domains
LNVLFINTKEAFTDLLKAIRRLGNTPLALDTETTGLDPFTSKLLLIQIGTENDSQAVIDVAETLFKFPELLPDFKDIMENPQQVFILHNAKFDYKVLKHHLNIELLHLRDTIVAAHLIRAGIQKKGFGLDVLLADYNIADLSKSVRQTFVNHKGPFTDEQIQYAADDVTYLHKLHKVLMMDIIDLKLDSVYNLECEVIPVTGDMELNGLHLDFAKWSALEAIAKKESLTKKEELDKYFLPYCDKDLFGDPIINYNSPLQLKPILEKILGHEISGTGKDVLERLVNPTIRALLKYREYETRVTRYGSAFYKEHKHSVTGRIHPTFIQVGGTDSGRYSSRNPNAQNIPRETAYRAAFIAEPGWKIVGADYASMELVLLAEFSKDPEFKKIFDLGLDAHGHVATMIMNKLVIEKGKKYLDANGIVETATEDINANLRPVGKSVNFGIAYGLGPTRLANSLEIGYDEAKELLAKFWKAFPKVREFLEARSMESLENECVRCYMDNRLRWLKGFNLRLPKQRAHAANIAKNMSLQSGNATITKKALALVKAEILKRNWSNDCKIISTIHDEILLETKETIANDAKDILSTKMIEAAQLWIKNTPVLADAYVADHWVK